MTRAVFRAPRPAPAITHAPTWLSRAFLYEVSPHQTSPWGSFARLQDDLDRLDTLGFTGLFLRSVFRVDAEDPPSVWGSRAELISLVRAAKRRGIRVVVGWGLSPSDPVAFEPIPPRSVAGDRVREWFEAFGIDGIAGSGVGLVSGDAWAALKREIRSCAPRFVLVADADRGPIHPGVFNASRDRSLARVWADIHRGRRFAGDLLRVLIADAHAPGHVRMRAIDGDHRRGLDLDHAFVRLATELLLVVPGVPLLGAGQELGLPAGRDGRTAGVGEGDSRLPPRLARLGALRRTHPGLVEGDLAAVETDHPASTLGFARRAPGQELLVVANLARRSLDVAVRGPAWRGRRALDLVSGDAVRVGERDPMRLAPLSLRLFELA